MMQFTSRPLCDIYCNNRNAMDADVFFFFFFFFGFFLKSARVFFAERNFEGTVDFGELIYF